MKNKKILQIGLQRQQELKKKENINKVLRAIDDMNNEERTVTISSLMEFTRLSRSTFAKPHIRELLIDYGYYQKGADNISKSKKKTKSHRIKTKPSQSLGQEILS